jgi:hypothetical protein
MVGEHVTFGGEADAETELDVSEAQKKSSDSKGRDWLRPHGAGSRSLTTS